LNFYEPGRKGKHLQTKKLSRKKDDACRVNSTPQSKKQGRSLAGKASFPTGKRVYQKSILLKGERGSSVRGGKRKG